MRVAFEFVFLCSHEKIIFVKKKTKIKCASFIDVFILEQQKSNFD